MKPKLLVSACLLGVGCRYDGERVEKIDPSALAEGWEIVPFCPEIYGGLPTPRTPSERVGDKVLMRDGTDVTAQYERGAAEAVSLCRALGIGTALLKARSPSCGKGLIYDGSFTSRLTVGDGVCAEALAKEGVKVYTEEQIELLLQGK
jgi:uncharacterized protein YbbK (DUF523 family)